MLKQTLVLLLLLCVLGGMVYLFIHLLLTPVKINTQDTQIDYTASSSYATDTTPVTASSSDTSLDDTAQENANGEYSDGPFAIMDAKGDDSGATVRILRSPEEVLLQFKDFSETYPDGSRLYLAGDLQATTFVDLGQAQLNDGVYLYDIPMDADTHTYPYIGIYSTSSSKFSYYAKVQ